MTKYFITNSRMVQNENQYVYVCDIVRKVEEQVSLVQSGVGWAEAREIVVKLMGQQKDSIETALREME